MFQLHTAPQQPYETPRASLPDGPLRYSTDVSVCLLADRPWVKEDKDCCPALVETLEKEKTK